MKSRTVIFVFTTLGGIFLLGTAVIVGMQLAEAPLVRSSIISSQETGADLSLTYYADGDFKTLPLAEPLAREIPSKYFVQIASTTKVIILNSVVSGGLNVAPIYYLRYDRATKKLTRVGGVDRASLIGTADDYLLFFEIPIERSFKDSEDKEYQVVDAYFYDQDRTTTIARLTPDLSYTRNVSDKTGEPETDAGPYGASDWIFEVYSASSTLSTTSRESEGSDIIKDSEVRRKL